MHYVQLMGQLWELRGGCATSLYVKELPGLCVGKLFENGCSSPTPQCCFHVVDALNLLRTIKLFKPPDAMQPELHKMQCSAGVATSDELYFTETTTRADAPIF